MKNTLLLLFFLGSFCYGQQFAPPYGTPLNRSHNLSQGLVGCWLLNEGGGAIIRNSTGYGQIEGSLIANPIFKPSPLGLSLSLNGSTQYGSIADNDLFSPATQINMTISCWVMLPSITSPTHVCFVGKGESGNYEWAVEWANTTGFLFITWRSSGIETVDKFGIFPVANQWYHLCMVITNGSSSPPVTACYVNGILSPTSSGSGGAMSNGTSAVNIGRRPDNSFYLNGSVADVVMLNKAITVTEVWQLYANSYSMFQK